MNEKELKLKLKEMKQELLNLKIAHERGLGVVSFFDKTATVEVEDTNYMQLYGRIIFPADTPENTVVFLEPAFSGADVYVGDVIYDAYSDRYVSTVFLISRGNSFVPNIMTCRAIASAPIISFSLINYWG